MYRLFGAVLLVVATCSVSLMMPRGAQASPWTLPEDRFVLVLDSNFQSADEEFLPDGERQAFPLNGEFSSVSFGVGGRYGVTDRFEAAFDFDLKQVSYAADPVLLAVPEDEDGNPNTDRGALNEAIFDFSSEQAGIGDAQLHGRYAIVTGLFRVTSQTSLKFPVGYERPRGTFAGDTPNPGAIEDDVSLGDGQSDISQAFLFGAYLPATNSFARLDLGFRHRFGTPGDQGFGLLSLGQFLGDNVLIFVGSQAAYTIFDGESIGKSFITRSPQTSAAEFDAAQDVEQIDLRLDEDFLKIEGGVILQLNELELRASYGQVVWGSNIPVIQSMSLGVVYSLDDVMADSAK